MEFEVVYLVTIEVYIDSSQNWTANYTTLHALREYPWSFVAEKEILCSFLSDISPINLAYLWDLVFQ